MEPNLRRGDQLIAQNSILFLCSALPAIGSLVRLARLRAQNRPSLISFLTIILLLAVSLSEARLAHAALVYTGGGPPFNTCQAYTAPSASAAMQQIRACTSPTQIFPQENPIWVVVRDDGVVGGMWAYTLTTTYQPCCGGGGTETNYGYIVNGTPVPDASSKDSGLCLACPAQAGDPIVMPIGNKTLNEVDFIGGGESPLRFARFYNSTLVAASATSFAQSWTHTYGASVTSLSTTTASVTRPDGKAFTFTFSGGTWTPDADVSDKLVQLTSGTTVTGWQYTNASDDSLETYDAYGNLSSIVYRTGKSISLTYVTGSGAQTFPAQLLSVTDSFGNTLAFSGGGTSRTMMDPNSEMYTYGLGPIWQIASVTYPDTSTKSYLYNESTYTGGQNFPYALTGVMD
jgi:hypothetical protein